MLNNNFISPFEKIKQKYQTLSMEELIKKEHSILKEIRTLRTRMNYSNDRQKRAYNVLIGFNKRLLSEVNVLMQKKM